MACVGVFVDLCFPCLCVCVCVSNLQPVELCSKASLVRRLFELHLYPGQEVPPHSTGKGRAHHHGDLSKVHLPANQIPTQSSNQLTVDRA